MIPGINDRYAHYLLGLGIGLIIGGLIGSSSHYIAVIFGIILMIAGALVSMGVSKNGKK